MSVMPSRKNRLSSINKTRIFAATIGSNARARPSRSVGRRKTDVVNRLFTGCVCSSLSARLLVGQLVSHSLRHLVLNDPLPAGVLGGIEGGVRCTQQFAGGRSMLG